MNDLKETSEVQRMWAQNYTVDDVFDIIKNDYSFDHDFELKDKILFAFEALDEEMKNMFLRILYGE